MAIIPYKALIPLREVTLALTKEDRRDPMVWLPKHLSNLFTAKRKGSKLTTNKRTSEDDLYGWMSNAFLEIFKKEEKKKMETPKEETFKINADESKKKSIVVSSQAREKQKAETETEENQSQEEPQKQVSEDKDEEPSNNTDKKGKCYR